MSAAAPESRNPFLDNLSPFNPFRTRRPRSASPLSPSPSTIDVPPPSPLPDLQVASSSTPEVNTTTRASATLTKPDISQESSVATQTPSYSPPPGPPPPPPRPTTTANSQQPPVLPPRRTRSQSPPPSVRAITPPPAYTPGPRALEGEQSVDFGPLRPYQQASVAPRPGFSPQHTGVNGGGSLSSARRIAPVPTGSSSVSRGRVMARSGWSEYPGRAAENRTGWSGQSQQPPPIPPRLNSQNTGASSSIRPPSNAPPPGIPTATPIPGHPLLREGKVLVYPIGYECHKCHNLGYKNYDPSHPCSKCWQKYSKAFTGPITYASWENPHPDTNFQRPLPAFAGPPARRPPAIPSSSSTNSMSPSYGVPPPRLGSGRSTPSTSVTLTSRPPPGALVVKPGDPRIGGKLCWNCGGDGVVSLFLFDSERCRVCGGMGRTF